MTSTTDVLDLMQDKLEAILRQHNATADTRKMRLIWGGPVGS
jgi:CBS-domain-containing membrane protein